MQIAWLALNCAFVAFSVRGCLQSGGNSDFHCVMLAVWLFNLALRIVLMVRERETE